MDYNVEVLKKMIENYDMNIKMFSKYDGEHAKQTLIDLEEGKKDLQLLIDNAGKRIPGVHIDTMLYSACAGADTSWWTRGT